MNKSESKYFNTAKKMNLALISLLKTKSFEYITINEICKTAGVNRSTFYLHYENTYDLLEETTRYILDNFLSYFTQEDKAISFNVQTCTLGELNFISDKYLTPYLSYIKDNKEIFEAAVNNIKSFDFENVYKRMYIHIFDPILERFNYPENDRKYVMAYYLNGVTAITLEWIKNHCENSIEEISKIIRECIFGLNNVLIKNELFNK